MLRGSAAATNARILAKHSVDVTQLNGHVFGTPDVEPAATATTNGAQRTRSRSRRRRAPPSVLVGAPPSPAAASWCSPSSHVCRTPAISCEAVPASIMVRRGHEPAPPSWPWCRRKLRQLHRLVRRRRAPPRTGPSARSQAIVPPLVRHEPRLQLRQLTRAVLERRLLELPAAARLKPMAPYRARRRRRDDHARTPARRWARNAHRRTGCTPDRSYASEASRTPRSRIPITEAQVTCGRSRSTASRRRTTIAANGADRRANTSASDARLTGSASQDAESLCVRASPPPTSAEHWR